MGTLEGMQEIARQVPDKGADKWIESMINSNTMLATHIKSQVSV